MSWIRLNWGFAGLILIALAVGLALRTMLGSVGDEQRSAFLALHRRYMDTYSGASKTGDVSAFPTLFYNDPAFDIEERAPDCMPGIERYQEKIETILISHGMAGQTSTPGVLSCMIADIFYLHESASAWDAVETQAAAEGRSPSIVDMPEGLQPIELPNFSDLTGSNNSSIQEARIQGDHATVTFAVPAYGSWYEHMLLTNRNGDWYISGIWNSGNP